jgi:hypothetical protein
MNHILRLESDQTARDDFAAVTNEVIEEAVERVALGHSAALPVCCLCCVCFLVE